MPALVMKAICLTGLGKFDEAKRTVESFMADAKVERRASPEDAVVSSMGGYAATFPINSKVIVRLIQWSSELGASEWAIAAILSLVAQRDRKAGREVAETIVRKSGTIKRPMPVLTGLAYLELGDLQNAKRAIAEVQSNHPLHDLQISSLRILIDVLGPNTTAEQDRVTFSNWIEEKIPKIQHAISELSDAQEKGAALGPLIQLIFLARRFGHSSSYQSLTYLADQIIQELNREEETSLLAPPLEKLTLAA